MATDVAVLIARLEADVRKFDKGMKTAEKRLKKVETQTKKTTKATKKMEGGMGKLGGVMKAVFAGAAAIAVFKFFKGALDRAEALNSAYAITEQVIQQTGGAANVTAEEIKKLSLEQAKLTGIDKELVTQSNNILLTFKNVANQVGENNDIFSQGSALILDMATVMGTDAKSGAIQLGKALNDPILGVTALNRVGIQFTDTQKEQIKNFQESGDLMSAQKIILKELEGQLGGTAEAAADTTKKIGVAAAELKEMAGRQVMGLLDDNLGSIITGFQKFGVALVDIAGLIFTVLHLFDTEAVALAEVDRAFLKAAIQTDGFIDTADEVIFTLQNINQETFTIDGAMERWIDTIDLTDQELARLVSVSDDVLASFGLSPAVIEAVRSALENKLNVAVEKSAGKLEDDLKRALFGVEEQADDTAGAIKNAADEILALTSPLFAAAKATRDADEAEANYTSTVAEFGPGTAETRVAAEDLVLARLKEKAALEKLSDESIPEAVREYGILEEEQGIFAADRQGLDDLMAGGLPSLFTPQGLLDMKIAKEEIEDILAAARGLKDLGPIRVIGGGAAATIREAENAAAGAPVSPNFGPRGHQGGIVPGPPGADVPIVAQAGERIIPTSQASQGAGGGDVNITIEGDLTEPVFEDLQRELILESIGRFVETR